MIERAVERALEDRRRVHNVAVTSDGPPPTSRTRQFTVHDALNGHYIEYMRRKYNPSGPDDYAREVYIVQPNETLSDAICTVLVLMEK